MNDLSSSSPIVRMLRPGVLHFVKRPGQVLFCRAVNSVLVCIYLNGSDQKVGGALLLEGWQVAKFENYFNQVIREFENLSIDVSKPKDRKLIEIKVVGQEQLVSEVKNQIRKKLLKIVADAVSEGFEAYFYPQEGRLRLNKISLDQEEFHSYANQSRLGSPSPISHQSNIIARTHYQSRFSRSKLRTSMTTQNRPYTYRESSSEFNTESRANSILSRSSSSKVETQKPIKNDRSKKTLSSSSSIPSLSKTTVENDKPKRVLIVDDSPTMCGLLKKILSSDPILEVVGEAGRPSEAEAMIKKFKPDVITLDIDLPEMDGVTFLERYLPNYPIPTVMVTAISLQEGDKVMRALNLGAVDYIQKPSLQELKHITPIIIEKVKTAAHVRLSTHVKSIQNEVRSPVISPSHSILDDSILVALGASTGGVQALEYVLRKLPSNIPPVVIVQHIPPVFSAAFAKRLNELCPFEVKEAEHGDLVKPGRVLIAPGGLQMAIENRGGKLSVNIFDGPPVNRHKPSVDVLFDSVAQIMGKKSVGVIFTGMGNDGAKGLLKMRQSGARTLAQDKESSVVYGMPREAYDIGAAEKVVSLANMHEMILRFLDKKAAA